VGVGYGAPDTIEDRTRQGPAEDAADQAHQLESRVTARVGQLAALGASADGRESSACQLPPPARRRCASGIASPVSEIAGVSAQFTTTLAQPSRQPVAALE